MGFDAGSQPRWCRRFFIATLLIFCSLLPGLYYLYTHVSRSPFIPWRKASVANADSWDKSGLLLKPEDPAQQDAYSDFNLTTGNPTELDDLAPLNIHLLVAASYPSEDLCKLMVSAGVLGFPSPVILNTTESQGSPARTRISAAFKALAQLPSTRDDDLAVVVESLDIWAQLRPQVLIDRFFAINQRADRVLLQSFRGIAGKRGIKQKIVFASKPECSPFSPKESPCYASPMRWPDNEAVDDRAGAHLRYLSSDLIFGHMKALKEMLQEAMRLLNESDSMDDRDIFAQMYGDQELYREILRHDPNDIDKIMSGLDLPSPPLTPKIRQHVEEVRDARKSRKFDFGIGLDHEGSLVIPEDSAFTDVERIRMGSQPEKSSASGRSTHSLPADIAQSIPPFWTFTPENLPRCLGWDDIPLLTNALTGTTPVFVRSTTRSGEQHIETWDRAWFANSTRTLYDAHVYSPLVPLAYNQRAWWGFEPWRGGGRENSPDFEAPWLRTDELCLNFHERVFRDGRGPWELPENH